MGVYRSTDKGRNWSRNLIYSDSLGEVSSLMNIDKKILAVIHRGLQVSNDYGITWEKINAQIWSGWTYSNALISIADTVYAGGILKSTMINLFWVKCLSEEQKIPLFISKTGV